MSVRGFKCEVIVVCDVLLSLYLQYDVVNMTRSCLVHGYWLHVQYFSCQMSII